MEAESTTCSGESPAVWGAPLLRGRQRNRRTEEQKDGIEAYWQCKVMSEDLYSLFSSSFIP